MSSIAQISEARAAAVELAIEELTTLQGKLPVASASDLEMTAASVGLCVTQLKVCAREMRELEQWARPAAARWWQE